MKILIIASGVGKTAPGIVYERLIQGLSVHHDVDVLASEFDPSIDLTEIRDAIVIGNLPVPSAIQKHLVSMFSLNPFDLAWALLSVLCLHARKPDGYDVVLSFLSNHHHAATIAGAIYSRTGNCKFAVHSIDAVPPPGWPEHDGYRKGVERLVRRCLGLADALTSTNKKMLEYQLKTFANKDTLLTNVVFNPTIGNARIFPGPDLVVNRFLYTGKLYGVRKVEYVLEAFEKLLDEYPNSCLTFVEATVPLSVLSRMNRRTRTQLEFIPFRRNLDNYYSRSVALIDIDADIEDDVFLSSKITNYILVNRRIISETGRNSPSRELFRGIGSIIQCDHNSTQIYEAMRVAISEKDKIDVSDREGVLGQFSQDNVCAELDRSLRELLRR